MRNMRLPYSWPNSGIIVILVKLTGPTVLKAPKGNTAGARFDIAKNGDATVKDGSFNGAVDIADFWTVVTVVVANIAVTVFVTLDVTTSLGATEYRGVGTRTDVNNAADFETLGAREEVTSVEAPCTVATKAPRAIRSREFWRTAILNCRKELLYSL